MTTEPLRWKRSDKTGVWKAYVDAIQVGEVLRIGDRWKSYCFLLSTQPMITCRSLATAKRAMSHQCLRHMLELPK